MSPSSRSRVLARRARGEEGAVLVLAFILLIVGMFIIGGLTFAVSNDLNNSNKFKDSRSLEYAATAATNQAIQSIRYTPLLGPNQTLNASPPSYCWGTAATAPSQLTNVNGVAAMAVWCSTVWNPSSTATRVVTFSSCLAAVSASTCASDPVLQAVVTYNDYPAGVSTPAKGPCATYCGTYMTLNIWVFHPVIPTISSISPSSGPVTGGTTVTISGTDFAAGSTVNFVEESGGQPTSDNVVVPATSVIVTNSSTLSAVAPAITAGLTYYVTVSTPTGTSAYNSSAIFTYVLVAPTVTGISPTSGVVSGGSSISVNGSGFVNGAVVKFVQESGGIPTSPSVVYFATNVSVVSSSSITAVTPTVSSATSYFVSVVSTAGSSTYGANAIFTYSSIVPTVASISPTSGPTSGGTLVTVNGAGFVAGASVTFVSTSSGVSYSGTRVSVASSSVLTVITPSIYSGSTFYVYVATPTGTSARGVIYTFN